MPLTTGQVLQNRYRIVALLGQGGMGAVYRAWDMRLGVAVALKEMMPEPGLDAARLLAAREQFHQEASVLSRLNHPHLVRVSDFFDEGGNTYLVMAFVAGESLARTIEHGGKQPEARVLGWADQLLEALAYCHREGVLHRDIKPQNVILQPDDSVVLVDFGLVKLWNPDDPRTRTAIRSMGTPQYAPPEQYDPQMGHTDPRSDLYSLGATIYHALTGQIPPTATSRIVNPGTLVPVRQFSPEVSSRVEWALERAMALQPDARFQSVAEMRTALSGAVSPQPAAKQTPAVPETAAITPDRSRPAPEAAPAAPRRKVRLGVAGTVIAVVVALCILVAGASAAINALNAWLATRGDRAAEEADLGPKKATATIAGGIVETEDPPTGTPTATPAATATPSNTATPQASDIPAATPIPAATATRLPTATPVPAAPALGDTRTRPADSATTIYVPAGRFMMGSSEEQISYALDLCAKYGITCDRENFTDEEPQGPRVIEGFWLDRTEVTNQQYSRCVAAGACSPPAEYSSYARSSYYGNASYADYPVINVSWYQAGTYCEWVGGRLPFEAEWEHAALGPEEQRFPWGNTFDGGRLNYCDAQCDFDWRDTSVDDGYKDTSPVCTYAGDSSWLDVCDLGGNVWEWMQDRYVYYGTQDEVTPGHRVLRGGTWHLGPESARSANRDHHTPETTHVSVGFRCVMGP
jgi:serine/threonine-protein kinase